MLLIIHWISRYSIWFVFNGWIGVEKLEAAKDSVPATKGLSSLLMKLTAVHLEHLSELLKMNMFIIVDSVQKKKHNC